MGMHRKTPTLAVTDPRGLVIRTVDYWRAEEALPAQTRIERTVHDPAGRAVKQWDPRLWALQAVDPLTPANLMTVFSLGAEALRSDSTDAGVQVELRGLGGEVLLGWDSRGTRRDAEYDALLRPTANFEEGASKPRRCVERFVYGHPGEGDAQRNQLGRLIRHDDPAGSVLFEAFAITGQCIENLRHFTRDASPPDWPQSIEERQRLLEPGTGATTQWRFAPQGPMLEQADARGHRQIFEITLDGRLRAAHLQLQHQPCGKALVSDIRYNAEGQVEYEVAGNRVHTTLIYRAQDGRLLERRAENASGVVLQHLLYEHDPMGNILSIEDRALPVRHFANQRIDPISRFRYDSLYQLSKASGWEAGVSSRGPDVVGYSNPAEISNYRQTYRYDAGGNLLQLSHIGAQNPGHQLATARYSNRCLSWRNGLPPSEAQIAAAFDGRGNLLELGPGRRLHWNLRNQLCRVTPIVREGGHDDRESYVYDGAGLRVRKIAEWQTGSRTVTAEHRYLPGLELRSHSGRNEQLQVITVSTGLNSVRVLHWESAPPSNVNDRYCYGFTDHTGSIGLELESDGQIISREMFYPFGATAWQDGDVSYKDIGYSGKEQDATGLLYFGFRYYAGWLQRWINPDPGEQIDGLNRYRAMRNNPVFYRDKDGRVSGANEQKDSPSVRHPEPARQLPQISPEDKGKIALGAQVVGRTLSYAKNPLLSAAGSILEAGGKMLEIHTAQAQMQARQRSQMRPLLINTPVAGGTLGVAGRGAEADYTADFAHELPDVPDPANGSPSPWALQLLAAGFDSAVPDETSMAVAAEEPETMVNKRNKRSTLALVPQI